MELPADFFKVEDDPTHSENLGEAYYIFLTKMIMRWERESLKRLSEETVEIETFAATRKSVKISAKDQKEIDKIIGSTPNPYLKEYFKNYLKTGFQRGVEQAKANLLKVNVTPAAQVNPKQHITNAVNVNVALVKSVAAQHLARLRVIIAQAFDGNWSLVRITKEIKKLTGLSLRRAQVIAYNEVRRALNAGRARTYLQSGVTRWMWQSSHEPHTCVFCPTLNGKIVKIGTPFGKSPFTKQPVVKPPDPHPNCRCTIVPVPAGYTVPLIKVSPPQVMRVKKIARN